MLISKDTGQEETQFVAQRRFARPLSAREVRQREKARGEAMTLALWTLHNSFDFDADALKKFQSEMRETIQAKDEGYISLKGINRTMMEETGYDFFHGCEASGKYKERFDEQR